MEDDPVELVEREEPVAADGLVGRGDPFQRPARRSPAKMMWTTCFVVSARPGAIESTIAIGPSSGGAVDPDLLGDLAVERVHQRLARVDAAAREQPDVPPALVVAAEQDAVAPAQERRDADPGLAPSRRLASTPDEPRPPAPRSVSGSSSTSSSRTDAASTRTSCAIRIPGSTTNGSALVGVEQDHLHLAAVARVDQARRVDDREPVASGEARARQHEARRSPLGSRRPAPCRRRRARPARARARSHAARSRPASPS